jgi:hypothetical protein
VIRPAIATLSVRFAAAQTERYSHEEFIWVTLVPKNIDCGVRGGGDYSLSRDYDIVHQTGLTILDTVLCSLQHSDYKPEPISIDICDLHPAVSEPISGRYHVPMCRALKTVQNWLQLVTQQALRVSGRHKHSTVAVMCQRNPEHSQCHFLRHKLHMYCPWTTTFAEKPATHRLTLGINPVFVFSNSGKAESILISYSLLWRSTFQAVQTSVHKSQRTPVHSALAYLFYRHHINSEQWIRKLKPKKIQFVSNTTCDHGTEQKYM